VVSYRALFPIRTFEQPADRLWSNVRFPPKFDCSIEPRNADVVALVHEAVHS
jgi:hypothetical protein